MQFVIGRGRRNTWHGRMYAMSYTNWTFPDAEARLRNAVASNISIAGVLRELNLIAAGGNYQNIKYHIYRLQLDTSHFKAQGHNKGKVTKPNNTYHRETAKRYLLATRGHQCEKCLNKTWNKLPVPLELEHIDGDNNHNEEHNLLLLCCNCHAQTKTWRRRKN